MSGTEVKVRLCEWVEEGKQCPLYVLQTPNQPVAGCPRHRHRLENLYYAFQQRKRQDALAARAITSD